MIQKWNLRSAAFAIVLSLATIAMVVGTRAPAPADAPYVTTPATSLTAASQVLQLVLAGQSSCTTSVTGTYTGALTRAYYDGQAWQTIATMSSGQTGSFTDAPGSAQRYRIIMGAGPTGTAVVVITCSPAVSIPGVTVTVSVPPFSPIPLPVSLPTGSTMPVAVQNTSAIPVTTAAPCVTPTCNTVAFFSSAQPVAVSNASAIPVTTAAPAPTVSPYAVGAGLLACPSTAPAAANSTYVATCDSNGYQNTIVTSISSALPVPVVTWPVTTAPPAATTPLPTASAGVTPIASAPPVLAHIACFYTTGTVAVTVGNTVMARCSSIGFLQVAAGAGGSNIGYIGICGNNGVTNCVSPAPQPTASAGAAPLTTAFPVVAYGACSYNTGTIAVTNTNSIATQCDATGNTKIAIQTIATWMPTPPAATVVATSIPTTGIMTSAKASAGVLVGATFTNSGGSVVYCGIYNTATAGGTTLGGTALVYVAVPATGTLPVFVPPTLGATFTTGITAGCATTYAGSTGVAANTVHASVFYY